MSRVSAPRVWGFPVVSLGFSFRAPLLSFLPLGASCDVGVPCMPSALLLSGYFWWLCLSSVCGALSFFCPVFRLSCSSCLCLSLYFDLFLILPRLPLRLFLPLLCLCVGASWCVSSYGFVVGWASCFLVLYCVCCLLVFLLVFTSCFRFVVLFSSRRGFAGVLSCRRVLSTISFTCFNLYSMMVPSLTAGSEYPSCGGGVGGGGGGSSLFVALLLRRRIPRVAF